MNRSQLIEHLRSRFPGNNPTSWKWRSYRRLLEMALDAALDDLKHVQGAPTSKGESNALVREGPCRSDYVLTGDSAWITVGNLSVYVRTTDEGVFVDIYPKDREMDAAIASTYAFSPTLSPKGTPVGQRMHDGASVAEAEDEDAAGRADALPSEMAPALSELRASRHPGTLGVSRSRIPNQGEETMSKKKSVAVRWRVPRRVPVLAAKTHLVPLWQACASGYTPRRAAEEFARTYWEKPRQVVWNEDNAALPKGGLGPAEPMTFRVRGGWRT